MAARPCDRKWSNSSASNEAYNKSFCWLRFNRTAQKNRYFNLSQFTGLKHSSLLCGIFSFRTLLCVFYKQEKICVTTDHYEWYKIREYGSFFVVVGWRRPKHDAPAGTRMGNVKRKLDERCAAIKRRRRPGLLLSPLAFFGSLRQFGSWKHSFNAARDMPLKSNNPRLSFLIVTRRRSRKRITRAVTLLLAAHKTFKLPRVLMSQDTRFRS